MKNSENVHNVYLALGTNLGNRQSNMDKALDLIAKRIGAVAVVSSMYETTPEGFDSHNNFLNAVCLSKTKLSPNQILEITQSIEREMGRSLKSSNGVYADRIIDIDILLYDDSTIDLPNLQIPHPELHRRAFVLDPLAEIAADKIHPILKETFSKLKKDNI